VRVVLLVHRIEAPLIQQAGPMGYVPERRRHDVLGVADALDAADLVAVVNRDRQLLIRWPAALSSWMMIWCRNETD
jgi:hypothetical protein